MIHSAANGLALPRRRYRRTSPGVILAVISVLEVLASFSRPIGWPDIRARCQAGDRRAPVKDQAALNVVVGVNDHLFEPARHPLLTAASCTTNCLAPVVKVLHEAIGIRHGQITTIHDPTNTNVVTDAPHKDLRRARSAMLSLSPTPRKRHRDRADLSRTQGQAERPCGPGAGIECSLTDCVFEMGRAVTAANQRPVPQRGSWPAGRYSGFRETALVSADYTTIRAARSLMAPARW